MLAQKPLVACSYCCDCLPCPVGIHIPTVFRIYNETAEKGIPAMLEEYRGLDKNASDCIRCGHCEKLCRDHVGISSMMFEISEEME